MNRFSLALVSAVAAAWALISASAATFPLQHSHAAPVRPPDFDREVRPILSENCFACHGFDAGKRRAGLRLDNPDGAYKRLMSGSVAVVPGDLKASSLARRVTATDGTKMPPPSSGKKLTAAQIDVLTRWVAGGGKYARHWAFVPPKRSPLPKVKNAAWCRNPVDYFILAKLEAKGMKPSAEADRRTLIRRLSFDLTGLPPTAKEVSDFVADRSPNAYEKVVDRLLASPRYGERMALKWLDLARYADTHGFHIDSQRDMWRWRDWVIDAYNANMPFNQFTIEQLAGDLLPNATLSQKIATGFNRNHPINFEGGAIPEEYAAAYIFDRIDTTATTWMGLTMRCAQCHDHKYEPLTQRDFYSFYAFFNNVPEQGLDGQKGNAVPFIKAPLPGQQEQLDALGKQVAETEGALKARGAAAGPMVANWERTAAASLGNGAALNAGLVAHYGLDEADGGLVRGDSDGQLVGRIREKVERADGKFGRALKFGGEGYVELAPSIRFERTDKFSYGAWVNPASSEHMTVLSKMDDAAGNRGWDLYLGDGKVYAHLISTWESNAIRVNTKMGIEANKWTHLFVTYDGSSKASGLHIYVNGKPAELEVTHDKLTDSIVAAKPAAIGRRTPGAPFKGLIDEVRIYGRELSAPEVEQVAGIEAIRQILAVEPAKRAPEQTASLSRYFLENYDADYKKLSAELADAKKRYADLDAVIPTTMVMEEMPKQRDTFILVRGQYDKKGEKVTSALPAIFEPEPPKEHLTRLDLAKWLVSPNHPLTARVAVNRYWEMLFGTGLVKTSENFGTQGEYPSHPELLDWLASSFAGKDEGGRMKDESGRPHPSSFILHPWDVKAMLRLLVTSSTYRQASRVSAAALEKDPENRLLSHAPRLRLPAEAIRDQALAVSGLLVPKIGGPSVKVYQPAGLWEDMSFKGGFSAQYYEQDHGEKLYRRSMYTFWKRTVPPPSLQTFDAPEREFCMVRRSTTNTPLQALVLMNDPCYVEASRKFAERVMTEAPISPHDRILWIYEQALSRPATEKEIGVLSGIFNRQLVEYRKEPKKAEKLLAVGESPRNPKLDVPELASWANVCSVVFNLDEMVTKN